MRSPLFGGLIAAAVALSLPVQAQSLYSVNQICGARNTCYASVLNDAGAVAGSGFFYSPALGYLNFAEFASSMLIGARDINSSGYVVGASTVLGGGSYTFAFLYRPGDRFLHDLNPVFGWEAGGANSINDSNVIIGSGLLP